MFDLSEVRRQGEIIELEKKKMSQHIRLPLTEKLDWFADAYQTFEQRIVETEHLYRKERLTEMIKLEQTIRSINQTKRV